MISHWYMDAKDGSGRTFCWAKEPTFICPLGDPIVYEASPAPEEAGRSYIRPEVEARFTAAAEALAGDPFLLASAVRRYHSMKSGRLRGEDGKLTDRCEGCGAKMERKGFRYWEERPKAPGEIDSGDRINARLSGASPTAIENVSYYTNKKGAEARARREVAATERSAA